MARKLFKIFLTAVFLGLFIVWPNLSFANINAPSGLTPCDGIQPLSVLISWDDQAVDHYELYYKKADETNWTDRYPSVPQYQLTGLTPSPSLPDNPMVYEWYIVSCGDPDCSDSAAAETCSFTTEELALPNGNGGPGDGSQIGLINPLAAETLEEALNAFINFLFWLAMAVAPILIVYAGFLLLTAAGDPAKISKARQVITWTLVATAIILFAKGLPALIKGAFGG